MHEQMYKNIEDVDAIGEYPERQNTDEVTSPVVYQMHGGHMVGYD